MIAILIAEGFEEIEALTPLDILRRGGLDVKTVGISKKSQRGSHGIELLCDLTKDEVEISDIDAVILPGGMPGTKNLAASPFVSDVINAVNEKGGRIAAICAAPLVLGRMGLLRGRYAVCYPGFEDELSGAAIPDSPVATHENITTSRGLGTALDFSLELLRLFKGSDVAKSIAAQVIDSAAAERGDERFDFKQKNTPKDFRI